jgi:hypothetical protein
MVNPKNLSNWFILNNMAERVGFELLENVVSTNIERTAGTVKQAVVGSANGSQGDHSLSVADHPLRESYWSSLAKI